LPLDLTFRCDYPIARRLCGLVLNMAECPSPETLEHFQNDALSPAEDSDVQAHVDGCADCARKLERLGDRFNDLVNHLKGLDLSSDFDASKGAVQSEKSGVKGSAREAETDDSSGKLPLAGKIPGYKILRALHQGGQGVVYQALQLSTKRKVAIKVLLEGPYAAPSARKRFEREIELVASLKHPNIVSIFDSGETADGRQFCVMDYVRGVPFDVYVKDTKLSVNDALKLFSKMCDAVNYAHQKGVIHRDLKPSNVLVDGDGEPRVLDFGLARQLVDRQQTMLSVTGQVVGTLPYLSPEQAEGNPDKVDIRSDVYALGVILYEVLTGQYPYPVYGQLAETLNHIVHTQASIPSKKWESQSGIKHYSPEGGVIERCPIDDEVNTIVIRALAKERDRRYQTAADLAQDIRRYLADEPIEAKRDSSWYVLRKRVKRYKMGVAVSIGVMFLVIVALIVTVNLYHVAERDRLAAEQARQQAEIEAGKARQTVAFTNEMLAGVDPETARGMDTRLLRMILARAAQRVQNDLAEQPEVAASIYSTIGRTYSAIGNYDDAQAYLRRALTIHERELGEQHLDAIISKSRLAHAYGLAGQFETAEMLFDQALRTAEQTIGVEHEDTLNILNNLGLVYLDMGRFNEAEDLLNRALEVRQRVYRDDLEDILILQHNLANVYEATARFDAAESMLHKTIEGRRQELGDDHPSTLDSTGNLAMLYLTQGRADEAEALLTDMLKAHRRVFGPEHPATLKITNNLANTYALQGRQQKSKELRAQTLDEMKRILGEEHPETLKLMNNLANSFYRSGQFDLAKPLYEGAHATRLKTMGPDHPSTLFSASVLARLYVSQRRFDDGEQLLNSTLKTQEKKLGAQHPDVLFTKGVLADLYLDREQFDKAEPLQRAVFEARRDVLGPDHHNTLTSMNNLGLTLARAGNFAGAEPIFRDAWQRRQRTSGEDHVETLRLQSNLMLVLQRLERDDEAMALQQDLLQRQIKRARGPDADADLLNETAWTLLTIEPDTLRDPALALQLSQRCNKLTAHQDAGYLDTLALAYFMTGDVAQAIEWEETALQLLAPDAADLRAEFEANLNKFRAALPSPASTQPDE